MNRLNTLLMRSLVWALAGIVFGGLFGAVAGAFQGQSQGWLPLTLATTIAGTITAAFFGSMLTALMGAMVGVLTAVVYLVVFAEQATVYFLLVIAAGLAFLAATLLPPAENLRTRPLGQTVSGLLAGLVAGPVAVLAVDTWGLAVPGTASAAVAVAVVGISFLVLSRRIAPACPDWLSTRYGAPVVAAIVATAVAAAQWLLASSITGGTEAVAAHHVEEVLARLPGSVLGGAIGGALGGAGLELLGIRQAEYHV